MMTMNHRERIQIIKATPLTWKEVDNLTAAEKYLSDLVDLPLVEFLIPCFPIEDSEIKMRIQEISDLSFTALHLKMAGNQEIDSGTKALLQKAIRVYEQETMRLLSHLFPLRHDFWTSFYKRQLTDISKALVTVDAMHHATKCQHNIAYQLVVHALQLILTAEYETALENQIEKNKQLEDASRLLVDLPIDNFRVWIQSHKQ